VSALRVLHCAETIKGGIATYLRELLILQREAFGSESVAVIIPASQVEELPVPAGVLLLTYEDSGSRIANAFALANMVLSVCKARAPSVAHVHSTFAGASVRPALAIFAPKVRVIYCPHGWAWDRPMSSFAKRCTQLVERLLAYMTTTVICISEHEHRGAVKVGIPVRKLSVVMNGVAAKGPSPEDVQSIWPEAGFRLLFVGRFDRQKGVDLLCNALEQLGPKASAVLAGGSVLADGSAPTLPSNAVSVGWVTPSQLETLFSKADVLVMPSRWEGFGLTAAEAMRAGLPVIATRVGGLPEIVVDGETGVLIESDSSEAICLAVRGLDRSLLPLMGQAGRIRFLKKFTMDRVHKELCSAYGLAPAEIP
jgi:glycosyltransferase involved in cell wall biosynthesis